MSTSKLVRAYQYVRRVNPHIPAWRVLEYVKSLRAAGLLDAAFQM